MSDIPHIPALRLGKPYESLDTAEVTALGSGKTMARVSMVNAGIIRRDARKLAKARDALRRFSCDQLLDICRDAGHRFLEGDLPLYDGGPTQAPDDYVHQLSATSGLPYTLVRANMHKVHEVLTEMPTILRGLTRGLDLSILDRGVGEQEGIPISFYPTTEALGVVLPSNSPGVNSLWIPAIALKVPVLLKPGREEPWTPLRVIQALIAAGAPAEAFGYYPTDHEGASAVMDAANRSIIFGGKATIDQYAGDPRVEVHGPGWSKVLIGDDYADHWHDQLDTLAHSIAGNSGRSCINASTILVPRNGRQLAEALAEKLAAIEPKRRDDPDAQLSGFANPKMAEGMNQQIDQGLQTPGAEDLTARARGCDQRKVEVEGITYLLPTLIHCESWDHPLANREFMFPYCAVVEMPQDQMLEKMGPSLVVTAITDDESFRERIMLSPDIQRLNLGPLSTAVAKWDQPHEGNLFEFLYHRRAIQFAQVPQPA